MTSDQVTCRCGAMTPYDGSDLCVFCEESLQDFPEDVVEVEM